jgi:hypothetical protein
MNDNNNMFSVLQVKETIKNISTKNLKNALTNTSTDTSTDISTDTSTDTSTETLIDTLTDTSKKNIGEIFLPQNVSIINFSNPSSLKKYNDEKKFEKKFVAKIKTESFNSDISLCEIENNKSKKINSVYRVERGKQDISLRPIRSHSFSTHTNLSTNCKPAFNFYGECFYCLYPSHSQKYCPLKQCQKCKKFGHSKTVCKLAKIKNEKSNSLLNSSLFQSITMNNVYTKDFPKADNNNKNNNNNNNNSENINVDDN